MNRVDDALRIAIVAPAWYPLPPRGYGGTELVVHLLHTELRRMGHEVTVWLHGSGLCIPPWPGAPRRRAWANSTWRSHAPWPSRSDGPHSAGHTSVPAGHWW